MFCNSCISSPPYTQIQTETIYYDPNNKSGDLMVNEDLSQQNAMSIPKYVLQCPHCRTSGCQKMVCPMITQKINGFMVKCYQSQNGCKWTGYLSNLSHHSQHECITITYNCLV